MKGLPCRLFEFNANGKCILKPQWTNIKITSGSVIGKQSCNGKTGDNFCQAVAKEWYYDLLDNLPDYQGEWIWVLLKIKPWMQSICVDVKVALISSKYCANLRGLNFRFWRSQCWMRLLSVIFKHRVLYVLTASETIITFWLRHLG